MASSSHRKATSSSSQRFYEYLNGLQEEFEHQSNDPGLSPRRFNVYLGGLKVEFELMGLEIESLQKERGEYREKVEAQARELQFVRHNFICERYNKRTTSAPQIAAPSQPKTMNTTPSLFSRPQFKSLNKLRANLTQKTPQPTQHTTLIQKLHSAITLTRPSRSSNTNGAHKTVQASASIGDLDSGAEQPRYSIEFNDEDRKELHIEITHELCHEDQILSVKFSQDGKYLAVGCGDGGGVCIYDVQTGTLTQVLRNLPGENDSVNVVCFSHDGKYLATGLNDEAIYIWEIKTRYVRNAFKGIHASLDFSPNGRLLVSTSLDNIVRVWNMRDGVAKLLIEHNPEPGFFCYHSAVFSPDGRHIAASNADGMLRMWDARTGLLMRRVKAHMDWVNHVAFMPDGKGLVSSSSDGTLRYWDIGSLCTARARSQTMRGSSREAIGVEEQTQPEREFLKHECYLASVVISPDGRWIVSGSDDRRVGFWDSRNAAMQCRIKHDLIIWTADFSPAGHYFASGGDDGMARIWRYSSIARGDSRPHRRQ